MEIPEEPKPRLYDIQGYKHISRSVADTNKKIQMIREGKLKPFITSSVKEQDRIGGYYPSDQIVLAARTGTGKTAKALQDMEEFVDPILNPHYADRVIVLYDNLEMPDWRNVLRFYSRGSKMEVQKIIDYKDKLSEESYNRIKAIGSKLSALPIYMSETTPTVDEWFEKGEQIQGKYTDCYLIRFTDHTRLIKRGKETSEEALITRLQKAGMIGKNRYEWFNYFLSQMNRSIETSVSRDKQGEHLPIGSDIFGSDAVFQCADIVLALHRPGMYGLTTFNRRPTGRDVNNALAQDYLLYECILKQRDGWTGNIVLKHDFAVNKVEDYKDN